LEILAIIPARAGSKGIPGKNIALVGSKPLILWTIKAAKKSKLINKIILSTNSKIYASLCKGYDVRVPFIRPFKYSRDESTSEDVAIHAIEWLKKNEHYNPDYILYLQPTSPLRTAEDIDQSIIIAKENNADSVVSVELTNRHPYFMKKIDSDGLISHYKKQVFPTPRRQDLDPVYVLNGAIFLVKTNIILERKWFGEKNYSYIMPPERSLEIDTPFEMLLADLLLRNNN
jgi:CMP-N,N'-diacetyllegionaminic acid synthase